jgi:hypothetical protein
MTGLETGTRVVIAYQNMAALVVKNLKVITERRKTNRRTENEKEKKTSALRASKLYCKHQLAHRR